MDQISVEKVIKPVHSSFSAVCYEHSYFEAPLHIHPEYELILIEQGEGYTFVGDMTDFIAVGFGLFPVQDRYFPGSGINRRRVFVDLSPVV